MFNSSLLIGPQITVSILWGGGHMVKEKSRSFLAISFSVICYLIIVPWEFIKIGLQWAMLKATI